MKRFLGISFAAFIALIAFALVSGDTAAVAFSGRPLAPLGNLLLLGKNEDVLHLRCSVVHGHLDRIAAALRQGDDAAASTSSENVSSLEQQFTALNQQQSQLRQRLRAIDIFAAEE